MLLSPRARGTSIGFLLGWVLGVVVAVVVSTLVSRSRPDAGSEPALPKWMAAIDSMNPVRGLLYPDRRLNARPPGDCLPGGPRADGSPLDELRTWLVHNNATVMAVLLLVIEVVLIGAGIGSF